MRNFPFYMNTETKTVNLRNVVRIFDPDNEPCPNKILP
jgi:hypothetical protein